MMLKCFVLLSCLVQMFQLTSGLEYCQLESFEAQCLKSEVVMMTMAKYGRMRVGKCISEEEASLGKDEKYIGCHRDVLKQMHERCSLEKECRMGIPNKELDKTRNCFPGLNLYLEAEYECLQVVEAESACRVRTSHQGKHLTSLYKGPCGQSRQPWLIEADRGQRIKVKVIFLTKDNTNEDMRCREVVADVVQGGVAGRNVSVCRKGGLRVNEGGDGGKDKKEGVKEEGEYVSTSNRLEVYLHGWNEKQWRGEKFSISFEADGCSDIIPHEDSWLKRNNDDLMVGCFSSPQTWYLRCENRRWIGTLGNCSSLRGRIAVSAEEGRIEEPKSEGVVQKALVLKEQEQAVVLAALCALGIIICLAIICFGCVCFKKCSSFDSSSNKQPPSYYSSAQFNQTLFNNHPSNNYPTINNNMPPDENLKKEDDNKYFVLETDK